MKVTGGQGSVEWLLSRVGKVTASRFKDVLGTAAKREAYLWEVVIERLTGNPTEHYANSAMAWGTENEPTARMRYESVTGAIVEEVGLVLHPALESVGGSPDGLVDADGCVEIKCPYNSANHLKTVLDGMPQEHFAQVQGVMWVTGREWCDFISFDPRLPQPLDMHIQRMERDGEFIGKLETAVAAFLADVETTLARLQPPPAAEPEPAAVEPAADPFITPDQCADLEALCSEYGLAVDALKKAAKVERLSLIRAEDYSRAVKWVQKHRAE